MTNRWKLVLAGLVAAATPAVGQQDTGYVLGPEDQIELTVYGHPDMTVKTRVRSDGTITVPVIGPVRATGRSPGELSDAVAEQLRKEGVIQRPVVSVDVAAFNSKTVTVLGALNTPGVYALDHPYSLSAVVARAGGIRPDGSDRIVLRRTNGTPVYSVDLATLATDKSADVMLSAGDTVFVPPAELFFVYGQVSAPGSYPMVSGMTLRQALARAGGPTLAGTEKKVVLYRQGKEVGQADLSAPVAKGDTLFVRERSF